MTDNRFSLPHLEIVFRLLSRGRHLCLDDGEPYWALREHQSDFADLFGNLGFALLRHPRDFFYFDGTDISEAGERITTFMFILIEHIGDLGLNVEESLMQREWGFRQLPHLVGDRYLQLMRTLGVTDDKALRGVVQTLERFGFAEEVGQDMFRLRKPAYRFLDMCMDIAKTTTKGAE